MHTDERVDDKINELMSSMQVIFGNMKAMEHALHVALTTHQNPALLKQAWNNALAEIVDANLPDQNSTDQAMFMAGLQEGLSLLTQRIDRMRNA